MAKIGGDRETLSASGSSQTVTTWGDMQELALLRSAVRAIGEAIIVTSPELEFPGPRIEYVNPGFERMTGYTMDEVVGRSPRLLQGPLTDQGEMHRLRSALHSVQSFHGEAINYRKDGTPYNVEWLITPVLEGGKVVHWVAAQRDVTERKRAEERERRMVDELNHRVNNSLAAVQSVAAQTFRDGEKSVAEVRDAFRDRLLALSRVHIVLAQERWGGTLLQKVAEKQVMPRGGKAGCIDFAGPDVRLSPTAAVALGMALHELTTNALRYGALSEPGGRVRLYWSVEPGGGNNRLQLHWVEENGPPVSKAPLRGFGSRLIERGLTYGLHARVRLLFEPSGLRCDVDAPLTAIAPTSR